MEVYQLINETIFNVTTFLMLLPRVVCLYMPYRDYNRKSKNEMQLNLRDTF